MQKKLTILIVDDNMNFVDRMITLLEDEKNIGYINVGANYDEGRRLFVSEEPDVVLLDINLPGKNGIELLKLIRQTKEDCKVIMITNHADEYYRQQCHELGARHFLDKSNDFAQVPGLLQAFAI